MSTEIAPTNDSQDIAERATAKIQSQITAEDLAIPRLCIGQPGSGAVQDGHVPAGSIYLATDASDPEPVVIYRPDQKVGVRVHLLTVEKVWVWTDEDKTFRVAAEYASDVPEEARRGYQLILSVPEFDSELPVSGLFKKTAIPTAKKILTTVAKSKVAPWESAFLLTTTQKANKEGRWHIPLATTVKAQQKHVQQAASLALLLGVGREPEKAAAVVEAVDDGPVPF